MAKTNKERFLELVSDTPSNVMEDIKWRRENRPWLKRSRGIAIHVIQVLGNRGWTQKEFAERMGVSPQQVSKWLKGQENFRLETISKMEAVLEVELIEVKSFKSGESSTSEPEANSVD
ncbi:helix-turn-helix transcriptional regulator [Pontibacter sp. G13]|uniref:helix-turn-helix domain-containing protein n=1 Tax=Pontibacter sp. G13 TaxID=3074898 RepID=UPI00288B7685|nr:helix-turn-helix transcriptional regulator [Pontibacter sp. G13]WNJ17456.1 helix-turn-helix transcriptional regulator [Pontibacter sp. G13]